MDLANLSALPQELANFDKAKAIYAITTRILDVKSEREEGSLIGTTIKKLLGGEDGPDFEDRDLDVPEVEGGDEGGGRPRPRRGPGPYRPALPRGSPVVGPPRPGIPGVPSNDFWGPDAAYNPGYYDSDDSWGTVWDTGSSSETSGAPSTPSTPMFTPPPSPGGSSGAPPPYMGPDDLDSLADDEDEEISGIFERYEALRQTTDLGRALERALEDQDETGGVTATRALASEIYDETATSASTSAGTSEGTSRQTMARSSSEGAHPPRPIGLDLEAGREKLVKPKAQRAKPKKAKPKESDTLRAGLAARRRAVADSDSASSPSSSSSSSPSPRSQFPKYSFPKPTRGFSEDVRTNSPNPLEPVDRSRDSLVDSVAAQMSSRRRPSSSSSSSSSSRSSSSRPGPSRSGPSKSGASQVDLMRLGDAMVVNNTNRSTADLTAAWIMLGTGRSTKGMTMEKAKEILADVKRQS